DELMPVVMRPEEMTDDPLGRRREPAEVERRDGALAEQERKPERAVLEELGPAGRAGLEALARPDGLRAEDDPVQHAHDPLADLPGVRRVRHHVRVLHPAEILSNALGLREQNLLDYGLHGPIVTERPAFPSAPDRARAQLERHEGPVHL